MSAMARSPSASSVPPSKPRLLGGVSFSGDDGLLWVSCCVLEPSGQVAFVQDQIRLRDLVRELWPDEAPSRTASLFRSLRLLNDMSKSDFLLRPARAQIEDACLVRTDFVRALVESHRVVFLRTSSPMFMNFLQELCDNLTASGAQADFSSKVIECAVCAAVTIRNMRWQVIKPVAEQIMAKISLEKYESVLQLYPLKLSLNSFIEDLRPLVQGLHETFDRDERHEHRGDRTRGASASCDTICQLASPVAKPAITSQLEETLDSWAHNAEELLSDASDTSSRIEDYVRFLEASLSCMRNRLLMFELWTMIITVALGFGALVSGIFGMNLASGLDQKPGLFWGVITAIFSMGILIAVVSIRVIGRSQHHYSSNSARFGNNKFFRNLHDDQYVLQLSQHLSNSEGSHSHVDRLMRELTEPAPLKVGGELMCRRRSPDPAREIRSTSFPDFSH